MIHAQYRKRDFKPNSHKYIYCLQPYNDYSMKFNIYSDTHNKWLFNKSSSDMNSESSS